jgi:hypothetical protein
MSMINEELNYMKYLLGYQRGVVISEQKILLEQTKADYENIISQLSSAYGPILKKYGFDSMVGYGIENFDPNENYDDFPPLVKLIGPYTNSAGKTIDGTYFACKPGTKFVPPGGNVKFTPQVPSPNNLEYTTTNNSSYNYEYQSKGKDATEQKKLGDEFNKAINNIAVKVCELLNLKEKGQDVTKQIQAVVDSETKAQQTTTQQTTTQQTTTQQTTTKPGTTTTKTTTKPAVTGGLGSNQYTEPIIVVKDVQAGDEIFWTVEAFGYFETSSDTSGFGKILADKLRKEVFGNKKLQELLKDPQKNVKNKIAITSMYIRGGASNRINKSVTPAELSGLQKPLQRDATIKKITDESTNFTDNKTLATNRADGIWNYLKADLPKNAQKIRISNNISLKKEGYIVETGGVEDTSASRDWTKYPIPGQHVYISFTIELRPVVEPDKVQSTKNKCFWNCSVELSFGLHPGSASHDCDPAAFGVWANDIYIGHIDLGNSTLITSKRLTQKTQGAAGVSATKTTPTTNGGSVSGTLKITDETLAKRIIDASKSGEVEIKVKGDSAKDYNTRNFNADQDGTHAEIPWMRVITSTGKIIYDNKANTSETLARCGGKNDVKTNPKLQNITPCPAWSLGQFNPCATNKEDGSLSKIAKKS